MDKIGLELTQIKKVVQKHGVYNVPTKDGRCYQTSIPEEATNNISKAIFNLINRSGT